jgi:CO dehydrogenase maturation factor
LSAEQLLGSVSDDDLIIVADLEAGIGTLTRLAESSVDVTLVVVEPTPRSIDVGQPAVAVADDQTQGRLIIVANKVADEADRDRVLEAFPGREVFIVPEDADVVAADRAGVSPVDVASDGLAVSAIEALAALLVEGRGELSAVHI